MIKTTQNIVKLSVAIATFNEEKNIGACLESVKDIAQEIVIVDGSSTDKTVEIAKAYGAKVLIKDNPAIFHINKQLSFERCNGEWILYLDADERVSKQLATEIELVICMNDQDLVDYQTKLKQIKLFRRHQQLLDKRDGKIGDEQGEINAFFIPRLNFFLGKYLKHGGVYPDGVIRLFKKNMAYLPAKDVHEQMVVKGRVGWLANPLYHIDSPTFSRYLFRNSRYIDLIAAELKQSKQAQDLPGFIKYCLILPLSWFLTTQIRHKGFLDGYQGVIFSFFSALRFPRAYFRYISSK